MSITVSPIDTGLTPPAAPPPVVQSVPLPGMSSAQTTGLSTASGANAKNASSQITQAQIQTKLDSALQKNGIHTEIENEKSGLMVVRLVQADTGAVVIQLPTQTAIDLVASMTESHPDDSPLAGHLYDRSA